MSTKNKERRSQKTEETIKKEEICKMMKNKKKKQKTKVGLRVRPAMLVALKKVCNFKARKYDI